MKKLKYLLLLFLLMFNLSSASILGGGGGADVVWQMKTYYEAVEIKAKQ